MADAGWYPDPQDSNAEQYWDGQTWSGQRRAAGSGGADQSTAQGYQPGYQQPGYQQAQQPQPPYQQPQYAQPQYAQPTFQQPQPNQPPGYQQGGYGQPGYSPGQPAGAHPWGAAPPPPTKKRRNLLIAAGVVVVLLVAGLVTVLVLPGGDAASITYQGKSIKAADTVLSSAESSVNKTVSSRHGVKGKDTRCYFVQAEKPVKGTKRSDVDSSLSCGPVLFVDGNTAQEYLPVGLTADTSGGKAVLTPQSSLDGVDPSSVRSGYKLVRPDGEAPPSGTGGLTVPAPPPTTKDSITSASLGSTPAPPALAKAVMVGRTRKVTVSSAGYISRYGSGNDARSAPSGQKLLAFSTSYDAGDISSGNSAEVKLLIDGVAHDVPDASTDEYVVAAVPSTSTTTLQLIDSGDTQSLSLPQGQPGSNNLAVLTRTHRTQLLGRTFNVPIQVRKGSRKADVTFKTTATLASLDYWPPANTSATPSKPGNALLSVRVNYTDSANPGGPYGYDPALLRLRLPDGTYVKARNVAPSGKVANVFEVPASFTTGTLQITGTERESGVTATVRTTKQIAISIAAG